MKDLYDIGRLYLAERFLLLAAHLAPDNGDGRRILTVLKVYAEMLAEA